MKTHIRLFAKEDWHEVAKIYQLGILTKNATFETEVPDYGIWIKKFRPNLLWVIQLGNEIVGWAGLQPSSTRKVYEGVMEVTIYIHQNHGGKGIGTALMNHLVHESEKAGVWTLYASIFKENTPSLVLHQKAGFREIGYREKIARLDGIWRDTILFERRSKITGL